MAFFCAVAAGGLFAWIAVQIGFYAAWILFFNLLLSAYMAIALTPVLIANVPDVATTPYGYALSLLCIAIATLAIAYGLTYACVSGRLRAAFPRAFDNVGAGLLGFLAGFLTWSFLTFAFCLTPVSQLGVCTAFGFDAQSQKTNTAFLCWWCDRLHGFVSAVDTPSSKDSAHALLAKVSAPAAEIAKSEALPESPEPPKQSPPAPLAPAAKTPLQPELDRTLPRIDQPSTLAGEIPDAANAGSKSFGAESGATPGARPVRRAESVEEEFARQHVVAGTPDAVEAAVARRQVGIIEIADDCNAEQFDLLQTELLQRWVSDGGILWANNNVLSLFGIHYSELVQWSKEMHCTASGSAEAAPILADCKRVTLKDVGGKAHALSSRGVMPLLTLESDLPFKHKAGTPCWSLVPYGKGWISDTKTVDVTRDDGARFWRNFRRFCLNKAFLSAPSGEEPWRAQPPRMAPRRGVPFPGSPYPPAMRPATPPRGLSGVWQASTGAQFHIRDDGKALTINLRSGNMIQVFTGKLVPREDGADTKSYAGSVDVVFRMNAPKSYTIDVTVTLGEAGQLRLRCSKWPQRWYRGRVVEWRPLTDVWTRADSDRERGSRRMRDEGWRDEGTTVPSPSGRGLG
jgi:hypothetical protein